MSSALRSEHVQFFHHIVRVVFPAVRGPFVDPAVEGEAIPLPVEVDACHSVPVPVVDGASALDPSQLLLLLLVQRHEAEQALDVLCSQQARVDVCRALIQALLIGVVASPVVLLQVAQRRGAALHAQHQEHGH